MALQDLWLEGIDVDAALYDIRDDDTQAWEVRALAGASIGIDPIAGLRAVIELSTAMERIVRGENDGKAQLASILGRAGDDYQRCLWYTVAGRDPPPTARCEDAAEVQPGPQRDGKGIRWHSHQAEQVWLSPNRGR